MKIIDVSDWQTDDDGNDIVNWQGIKDEGIDGVIVKIGEAGEQQKMATYFLNKSIENGLKVGIYYYGRAKDIKSAQEDAGWVSDFVKEYINGTCPELGIYYDAESGSGMDENDATECCIAFVDALHLLGYDMVGIYTGYNWLHEKTVDLDRLDGVPIWVAQYNTTNDIAEEYPKANVLAWQYTDHYSDELPYDASEFYLW